MAMQRAASSGSSFYDQCRDFSLGPLFCMHRRSQRSYIITGGLGGFGLALAVWLANRGAAALRADLQARAAQRRTAQGHRAAASARLPGESSSLIRQLPCMAEAEWGAQIPEHRTDRAFFLFKDVV